MSTQRYVSTSFWDDEWIQSLDPSEKFFYLYLMTNPLTTISGVYKVSDRRIAFDTGFNADTIKTIMEKFEKSGKAFRMDEYIVLPTFPKHQKWEKAPRIKEGIILCLMEMNEASLKRLAEMNYRFDLRIVLDRLSIPYDRVFPVDPNSKYPSNYSDPNIDPDKDRDKDRDRDKDKGQFSLRENLNPNSLDLSKRIEILGNAYNDLKIGPPFKKTALDLSPPEMSDLCGTIKAYPDDVSIGAMKNYKRVTTEDEFDPGSCTYKSFIGFMKNGVEKYCDEANPLEIFKKKGQFPRAGPDKHWDHGDSSKITKPGEVI